MVFRPPLQPRLSALQIAHPIGDRFYQCSFGHLALSYHQTILIGGKPVWNPPAGTSLSGWLLCSMLGRVQMLSWSCTQPGTLCHDLSYSFPWLLSRVSHKWSLHFPVCEFFLFWLKPVPHVFACQIGWLWKRGVRNVVLLFYFIVRRGVTLLKGWQIQL